MEKLNWISISDGVNGIKRQVAFDGLNSMSISSNTVKAVFLKRFIDDQGNEIDHFDLLQDRRVIIDLNNQHLVDPSNGMVIYPTHENYGNAVPQFDFWWPKFIDGSFYGMLPLIIQQLDNLTDENGNSYSRFNIK